MINLLKIFATELPAYTWAHADRHEDSQRMPSLWLYTPNEFFKVCPNYGKKCGTQL